MTSEPTDTALSVALLSEVIAADQMVRSSLSRNLPRGMEMSHFSVLSHIYGGDEKSPAQLARNFSVTKGAMTNTLTKLEAAGFVHIRPDWDDARKKLVAISPAGRDARDRALAGITPILEKVITQIGGDKIRQTLPVLREFRALLAKQ